MKNRYFATILIIMLIVSIAPSIPLLSAATEPLTAFAADTDINEIFDTIADANTLLNDSNKNDKLGFLPNIELKTGIINAGYKNRRGYVKFDLSSVSKPIQKAKLRLSAKNITDSTTVSLEAYRITDDSWQESTITGANAPAMADLINSVNVNSTLKYYEIDVTDFVQEQITSDKIISMGLMVSMLNKDKGVNVNSKEGMASPPKLFIDYMSPDIDSIMTAPAPNSYYLTGKDVQFTGSASDDTGNCKIQRTAGNYTGGKR